MNTKTPDDAGAFASDTHEPTSRRRRRARQPFPETSRLAFERASAGRWVIYDAILSLLAEHGPLVDDELYRLYLLGSWPLRSRQNLATARRELADAGIVRDTGRRGLSDFGNPATLWEAAHHEAEEA